MAQLYYSAKFSKVAERVRIMESLHQALSQRLMTPCQGQDEEGLTDYELTILREFYNTTDIMHSFKKATGKFKDALAAVDLLNPNNTIYFTKYFFDIDDEEKIKTLIHEITHLKGWTHGDEHDPGYDVSPPVRAEKCITRIADTHFLRSNTTRLRNIRLTRLKKRSDFEIILRKQI